MAGIPINKPRAKVESISFPYKNKVFKINYLGAISLVKNPSGASCIISLA